MPYTDNAEQLAAWRRYYHRQSDAMRERRRKNKAAMVAWFREYKRSLKCNRCPETHPACLEFHHKDPRQKEITVTEFIRHGWGKKRILAEIAKCEVICSNCHRKHHWEERHGDVEAA